MLWVHRWWDVVSSHRCTTDLTCGLVVEVLLSDSSLKSLAGQCLLLDGPTRISAAPVHNLREPPSVSFLIVVAYLTLEDPGCRA